MRNALLILAVLAIAGCTSNDKEDASPTNPATSIRLPPLDSLSWTGSDCAELGLFVRAPATNVRPFVHSNFSLIEAQGQATLAIGMARCQSGMVLENRTNNMVMSDVGVFVEDPEGGDAPALYQFWHASNRNATVENMSRVGLPTHFAPHSHFLTFGLVQATLVESRIASVEGAYLAQGTSPSAPAKPGGAATPPQTFRWWHASDNGTMYTDFTLAPRTESVASGNLSFAPGSALARMVGDTEATGQGIYWTFDLTAVARRV